MAFGLTPWDPFRDLERFERTMRRGLDWPFFARETIGSPAVELSDEGDHYLVKAELPGVEEDDVEISLTGNVLSIRGEKREERTVPEGKEAEKGEHRPLFSECYYGSFERMLTLPDDINPDQVEAEAKNGVYSIHIGKKSPQQRSRKIQVTRH